MVKMEIFLLVMLKFCLQEGILEVHLVELILVPHVKPLFGLETAYAIVTNSSSASTSSVWNKVVAHEVGHNLNGSHTTTGFMKQGDHSNSTMSSTTVSEFDNYISNNNGCMPLKTCAGWR